MNLASRLGPTMTSRVLLQSSREGQSVPETEKGQSEQDPPQQSSKGSLKPEAGVCPRRDERAGLARLLGAVVRAETGRDPQALPSALLQFAVLTSRG